MKRSLRVFVYLVAGGAALASSGSALAAYNPSLLIAGTNHALSRSAPIVIGLDKDDADDATAEATIYAPRSYRVALSQAPGTQLGGLSGQYAVGARGGAKVDVEGTVRADNPANYATNTCAPGVHQAVWVLQFTLEGAVTQIPVYVDRVTGGPEAAYASVRMKICLGSPYVPPPAGTPSGTSLIVVAFSVRGVFTNPTARGTHGWNAIFTPFTPGTTAPNPALTAQSTSYVRLPVRFGVSATRQRRGKRTFALVTACLNEAGVAIRGIRINFVGGRSIRGARRLTSARTNARGCSRVRVRVRTRTMIVLALADVPPRQAPGCQPAISARCSRPSIAPLFDLLSRNLVRIRR